MKILNCSEYISEKKGISLESDILVIVDVQREFSKWIPKNFVEHLMDYSKKFDLVYQIYDTNKVPLEPLYEFKNKAGDNCENIPKRFGHKWFDDEILAYIEKVQQEKDFGVGKLYKLENSKAYIMYNNTYNHRWFYINPEQVELYEKLKGKKVVLVGGSSGECITDCEIAMKQFGVNVVMDHNYIYSADTSKKQKHSKKEYDF